MSSAKFYPCFVRDVGSIWWECGTQAYTRSTIEAYFAKRFENSKTRVMYVPQKWPFGLFTEWPSFGTRESDWLVYRTHKSTTTFTEGDPVPTYVANSETS